MSSRPNNNNEYDLSQTDQSFPTCLPQNQQNQNQSQNQSQTPDPKPNPNPSPLSPQDVPSEQRKVKPRRSRTGCLTCRTRKIKCDETPGKCGNCERVLLKCRWPVMRDVSRAAKFTNHSEQQGPAAPAPAPRQTRHAVCRSCRVRRYKCSRDRPSCLRCSEQDLVCDYDEDAANQVHSAETSAVSLTPSSTEQSSTNEQPTSSRTLDHGLESEFESTRFPSKPSSISSGIDYLPRHLLDLHLDAFFTHIYPCQANAFIHRGTLFLDIQSGRAAKMLLLAICAVSSRFIPSNEQSVPPFQDSTQALSWAREAKTMLILEEEMSTDTVATALLLAKHDINSGKYGSAWMLSSIANRAALALSLYKGQGIDSKMTWIEQETRRRLIWSCYCLDRMMSTGVPEFVLIRTEHVRIQLPCEEHHYLLGIPCVTPVPNLEVGPSGRDLGMPDPGMPEQTGSAMNIGMFGHYVQIMGMRYMILKCARSRNDDPNQLPPWDPSSTFSQCDSKMSAWRRSLLPQFQLRPDTIYARQTQNQLTPLIMLHIWYDQCMSDLYRITLPGFPESLESSLLINAPAGWVERHQLACVRHASNIGSTFHIIDNYIDTKTFAFLDASLPMCVFESIRVQVQWFFMLPPEAQAEKLREILEGFEHLMGYVEKMTKYFRQAQWLLKEMRKLLIRHGFPIRHGSESNNNDTSGSRTPHHPWLRRIHNLNNEFEGDVAQGTLAATQMVLSTNGDLVQPNLAFDNSLVAAFHSSPQPAQNLASGFSFGPEPDMFLNQGMNTLLSGYDQGQIMPDSSSFLSMFGEWTAKGVEDGMGFNNAWADYSAR